MGDRDYRSNVYVEVNQNKVIVAQNVNILEQQESALHFRLLIRQLETIEIYEASI